MFLMIETDKLISNNFETEKETVLERLKNLHFGDFVEENKILIGSVLLGLALVGFGIFLFKNGNIGKNDRVEVLESTTEAQMKDFEVVAEVAGAVQKPGVYKLPASSRIDDLLIAAGGLSSDADRTWFEKYINRAAKVADGQKLYILNVDESANQQSTVLSANDNSGYQSVSGGQGSGAGKLININTASLKELDVLPGIGPVYGQSIIEHRPYSNIDELVSKNALKKSVYEKIKDLVTIY